MSWLTENLASCVSSINDLYLPNERQKKEKMSSLSFSTNDFMLLQGHFFIERVLAVALQHVKHSSFIYFFGRCEACDKKNQKNGDTRLHRILLDRCT